ncbi:Hypothetical predicted protein [Octopus vulgaris]|uniref:Uncharacterized protein n=1 Tax=Octopus vulgaris TaxID=6645 RepID=A0AA36AT03_OCTVU|nr:Hypothetical predicted protein [Octopus vulgaris]
MHMRTYSVMEYYVVEEKRANSRNAPYKHIEIATIRRSENVLDVAVNDTLQIIRKWSGNHVIMGRKCDLSASEKCVITSQLVKGKSTLDISKIKRRYHQTVKTIDTAPTKIRKRHD